MAILQLFVKIKGLSSEFYFNMKYLHLAITVFTVGLFLILALDSAAYNGILRDSRETVMIIAFIGGFFVTILSLYRISNNKTSEERERILKQQDDKN